MTYALATNDFIWIDATTGTNGYLPVFQVAAVTAVRIGVRPTGRANVTIRPHAAVTRPPVVAEGPGGGSCRPTVRPTRSASVTVRPDGAVTRVTVRRS